MVLVVVDPVAVINRLLAECADRPAAAERLHQEAVSNPELREALIARFRPNLLAEICAEAVQVQASEVRIRARRIARNDTDDRALISRVGAIKAELQLWTLPSGVKLQLASREQVAEAIAFHRAQVQAHRRAIIFYEAITQGLAPGQIVRDVLTDEQLASLLERAQA